jgi:hypothetical protein
MTQRYTSATPDHPFSSSGNGPLAHESHAPGVALRSSRGSDRAHPGVALRYPIPRQTLRQIPPWLNYCLTYRTRAARTDRTTR